MEPQHAPAPAPRPPRHARRRAAAEALPTARPVAPRRGRRRGGLILGALLALVLHLAVFLAFGGGRAMLWAEADEGLIGTVIGHLVGELAERPGAGRPEVDPLTRALPG